MSTLAHQTSRQFSADSQDFGGRLGQNSRESAGPVYLPKNEELARNCLDVGGKAEVTVVMSRRRRRRITNIFLGDSSWPARKLKPASPLTAPTAPQPSRQRTAPATATPGDVLQEANAQGSAGKGSAGTRRKKAAKTSVKGKPAQGDDAQPKPTASPEKKLSALDAAAKVLQEAGTPLNCQDLIAAMAARGYWSSPAGKTPASTLYAALLREIKTKGKQARFQKAARGQFVYQIPQAS